MEKTYTEAVFKTQHWIREKLSKLVPEIEEKYGADEITAIIDQYVDYMIDDDEVCK